MGNSHLDVVIWREYYDIFDREPDLRDIELVDIDAPLSPIVILRDLPLSEIISKVGRVYKVEPWEPHWFNANFTEPDQLEVKDDERPGSIGEAYVMYADVSPEPQTVYRNMALEDYRSSVPGMTVREYVIMHSFIHFMERRYFGTVRYLDSEGGMPRFCSGSRDHDGDIAAMCWHVPFTENGYAAVGNGWLNLGWFQPHRRFDWIYHRDISFG